MRHSLHIARLTDRIQGHIKMTVVVFLLLGAVLFGLLALVLKKAMGNVLTQLENKIFSGSGTT
jgi:hypothetical protein